MALQRVHPELDENKIILSSNKLRYDKPVSAPASPSASRSSTPRHFSDNDDTSSDDENEELKRLNSTSNSERSFMMMERPKSTENLIRNLNIKDE